MSALKTYAMNVIAHEHPEFLANLTDVEAFVLPYCYDLWLRPEQRIPDGEWRSFGQIAGRGNGKTWAIAAYINNGVERGTITNLALAAPTLPRIEDVQIRALIEDTGKPWFMPERYQDGVIWPNGVRAMPYTPGEPHGPRGQNFSHVWATELVGWASTGRALFWANLAQACRVGDERILWDTTSMGLNSLIQARLDEHAQFPERYLLRRGTSFDNPMLSAKYLFDHCRQYPVGSQRYQEEVEGKVFSGSAQALFSQDTLDTHRRDRVPSDLELVLVVIDPAHSERRDADETGIMVVARGRDGHTYVLDDLSGRYTPAQIGARAIGACEKYQAAGVVSERTGLGSWVEEVVKSEATTRGYSVQSLPRDDKPFPARTPGRIYLRGVVAKRSKTTRAQGPAAETEAGRVHIVGRLPELETELCTYEAGDKESPNRYDAFVYGVIECAALARDTPKDSRAAVTDAAAVQKELTARLRGMAGRAVGL